MAKDSKAYASVGGKRKADDALDGDVPDEVVVKKSKKSKVKAALDAVKAIGAKVVEKVKKSSKKSNGEAAVPAAAGDVKPKKEKKSKVAAIPVEEPVAIAVPDAAELKAARKAEKLAAKSAKKAAKAEESVALLPSKPEAANGKKAKKQKASAAAAEEVPAADEAPAKKQKKASAEAASEPEAAPAAIPAEGGNEAELPVPAGEAEEEYANGEAWNGREDQDRAPSSGRAFQRVKAEDWLDKKAARDNSYHGTFGQGGYGFEAQQILGQVRGKDFRHEKTKKKRGNYRGGIIESGTVNSFKFESDDE